jgi:hypothetical protein
MEKVKVFKLINGEEIIAEVLSEETNVGVRRVKISNPIRIVVLPNRSDPKSPTVGFAPWLEFTDDKTFTLDMANVLVIMDPIKEFKTQYSSMISGLFLPSSNKLLV